MARVERAAEIRGEKISQPHARRERGPESLPRVGHSLRREIERERVATRGSQRGEAARSNPDAVPNCPRCVAI